MIQYSRLIPTSWAFACLAALSFSLTACGSKEPAGLGGQATDVQFSEAISSSEFEDLLATGPSRVEIQLVPGSLVAHEVEVERPDALTHEEEIESRITDVEVIGDEGTLTLELGGLQVGFTSATRFRAEEGRVLTFGEFVARVETALAAGDKPPVEANRAPPAEPQAPDDASFIATELKLDDEADEPKIEINVDSDNFVANVSPPPDGWLRVLGLMIELRVSEGVTELEVELPDAAGEAEFEGIVQSVNLVENSFTLVGGAIVRIVEGTEIEEADEDDELGSLVAVADALDAGLTVEAEVEGVVESTDPFTIIAIEVEFEIEEELEDIVGEVDFEGVVQSVDLVGNSFTLVGGTVVRIVAGTEIEEADEDDELGSLVAVAQALDAGLTVEAEAEGVVESTDPLAIIASEVEFEVALGE
ncbi:MAG: hypothetical protein O6913_08610 [Chloroflexi bacterium]|nr:hypothetical protein [Chloroflexota bacterium]